MPNIFDQFDAPTATVAPPGTNPFDAFDGNVFDQFDSVSPKWVNPPGSLRLDPPISEKIDNLADVLKDLQDTLRGKLPVQGRQPAHVPADT